MLRKYGINITFRAILIEVGHKAKKMKGAA